MIALKNVYVNIPIKPPNRFTKIRCSILASKTMAAKSPKPNLKIDRINIVKSSENSSVENKSKNQFTISIFIKLER
jgi:hypothetical protein